jgi:3-dehydroquinate dehydratase-2
MEGTMDQSHQIGDPPDPLRGQGTRKRRILVINGPNLNLLGTREPGIYGNETLTDVEARLARKAVELDCEVECRQSNFEGEIVGWIHDAGGKFDAVVMNPGAFAHYSYAIRDAVSGAHVRLFEVHISNIHKREEFRHTSVTAPVAVGMISGLGTLGYELALQAVLELPV